MRVLIDEQLSESLLQHIHDLSADAVHVRLLDALLVVNASR